MQKILLSFLLSCLCCDLSAQITYSYDNSGNRIETDYSSISNYKPTISSVGDTLLISSSANYYQWYFNNNKLIDGTNKSLQIRNVGFYKVETSPNKLCWFSSDDYPILVVTTPLPDTLSMKIYPNPANSLFNIALNLQRASGVIVFVTIHNELGVQVLQTNKMIFFGNQIKIPITLSEKGVFSVTVFINGSFITQKVILM